MTIDDRSDVGWDGRFQPVPLKAGATLVVDKSLPDDFVLTPDGGVRVRSSAALEVILVRAFFAGKAAAARELSNAYKGEGVGDA
ncbi:MAG: hypothetical protein RIG82_09150 [Phycisphaeraceae bacterium]